MDSSLKLYKVNFTSKWSTLLVHNFHIIHYVIVQASSKVEIDPDAPEKLLVTMADFMSAIEHDIKPVSLYGHKYYS